jgi:hypothetical protein
MLTIKIVQSDKDEEEIFEASLVNKEANGLLCQTDHNTLFIGPGGAHMALDWDGRNNPQLCQKSRCVVYVMNRFGATVASYHL